MIPPVEVLQAVKAHPAHPHALAAPVPPPSRMSHWVYAGMVVFGIVGSVYGVSKGELELLVLAPGVAVLGLFVFGKAIVRERERARAPVVKAPAIVIGHQTRREQGHHSTSTGNYHQGQQIHQYNLRFEDGRSETYDAVDPKLGDWLRPGMTGVAVTRADALAAFHRIDVSAAR